MSPEKEGCASRHWGAGKVRYCLWSGPKGTLEFLRGTGVRDVGGEALGERTACAKVSRPEGHYESKGGSWGTEEGACSRLEL